MTIKADKWIKKMSQEQNMIEPFESGQVKFVDNQKIVSYGTSSYGYDVRCADEFKIFTNINSSIVDPKNFDNKNFVDFKGDVCIIPPNSFALARTVEKFKIPRDVLVVCLGKSTYARCGIIVNVTPLEPEWEGYVTLEFSNTTPLPAKIYANEGVAQMLFFQSDESLRMLHHRHWPQPASHPRGIDASRAASTSASAPPLLPLSRLRPRLPLQLLRQPRGAEPREPRQAVLVFSFVPSGSIGPILDDGPLALGPEAVVN